MAVELEIRDGDPWWLSPDIWTVPGDNPEGPPGTPIAGEPCYLWARVRNRGSSSVTNAQVRFYWANPSLGFDRNTATPVGTSNVNLASDESADVLCLTPWVPIYVNEGHECVLAEAFHPSLDPLPATLEFNVPTDRHVAQRNLSVALAAHRGFFRYAFVMYNTTRVEERFQIRAYQSSLDEIEPLAQQMRLDLPQGKGKLVEVGFVDVLCPTEEVLEGREHDAMEVSIPGNGSRSSTLVGRVEGEGALVHVVQLRGDQRVGGLSILVLAETEQKATAQ